MSGSPHETLLHPAGAWSLLVLAHGAGAGMRHGFMGGVAAALARQGVATYRFDFPYMVAGRRLPDRPPVLVPAVRRAVAAAHAAAPELPLFAGGKSLGGRMTSTAASEAPLCERPEGEDRVQGLVFLGFPLHPPDRPGVQRADHLDLVELPMLFVQGDRDRLAELDLLRPVVARLGERAALHVVRGADHGFKVLKRSGRSEEDVFEELAATVAGWMRQRIEAGEEE